MQTVCGRPLLLPVHIDYINVSYAIVLSCGFDDLKLWINRFQWWRLQKSIWDNFSVHLNQKHRQVCWAFQSGSRNLPLPASLLPIFLQRHERVEQFWSLAKKYIYTTLATTLQLIKLQICLFLAALFKPVGSSKVDGINQSICFQYTLSPTFALAFPLLCQLPAI